ncbi:hypothetical protein [Desulfofundulus thermocisternus]|uniref:hypothetical protein n=1 Tax=Desulfofundulus thermocisternus TaxID=42471 RepID=UPI000A76611C|nr:hypothetical protein [Desulfofundulus thermocisternus]
MWMGEWGYPPDRHFPEEADDPGLLSDLVDVLGSFVSGALIVVWLSRLLGPVMGWY